jgi:membrane protein DedA with SNARE-associated domain
VLVAALWGFAEATLFFLVPDIWLTLLAVKRGRRPALLGCFAALAGALLGGLAMYGWGAADPATARAALDYVPAIDPAMIGGVRETLQQEGIAAVFLGPLMGVPYKIYAVEAGASGIGLAAFLAVSIPARLMRFLLLALGAWAISSTLSRYMALLSRIALLAGGWMAFYAVYFSIQGL